MACAQGVARLVRIESKLTLLVLISAGGGDFVKIRILVGLISVLALSGCDTPMSKAEQAAIFDRTARSAGHRLQRAIVLCLAVGLPGDVVGEHREIVRDDRVILLVGPITGHRRSQRDWR